MTGFNTDSDNGSSGKEGFNANEGNGDNQGPFLSIGSRVFATQDELVKHVNSAQEHIDKLESEAKAKGENLDKLITAAKDNVTMRDVLEGMKNATQTQTVPDTQAATKEEVIAEAVALATKTMSENLKTERQKTMEEDNLSAAMDVAEKQFGEKYKEKVVELGVARGLTPAQIDNLAKTSPIAFKQLFIPVTTSGGQSGVGDLNTQAFNDKQGDTKKASFMKLTNSKERSNLVQERIKQKLSTSG